MLLGHSVEQVEFLWRQAFNPVFVKVNFPPALGDPDVLVSKSKSLLGMFFGRFLGCPSSITRRCRALILAIKAIGLNGLVT